jgi:hypothetical protein
MKASLAITAAALAHLVAALPHYNPRSFDDYEEYDDLEERDDECGAPEPVVSTLTVHHTATVKHSSTTTPTPTAIAKVSGGNPFIPNGIKAGLSGFPGINQYDTNGMDSFSKYIGWYSDYTAVTPDYKNIVGVPMVCLFPCNSSFILTSR